MTYEGPERRKRDDFEREVIGFMSRIDEHMTAQKGRCDSHSADIRALSTRTTSLEDSRTFVHGMIVTATKASLVAVGISGIIYGWIESFGPHIKRGG